MKPPVIAEVFINSPSRFFHSCWVEAKSEDQTSPYSRVLSEKYLIIPEAAMFSKILSYHKKAKLVKYYSD